MLSKERIRFFLPFILLIAVLAVSTSSIFIRFAQAEGASALVIAALRLIIAALLLAPITLIRYKDERIR